jgi:hypothetical protein
MPVPNTFKKVVLDIIAASAAEPMDASQIHRLQRQFMQEWTQPEFVRYRQMMSGILSEAAAKAGEKGKVYLPNLIELINYAGGLVFASPEHVLAYAGRVGNRVKILEDHEREVDALLRQR